MSTTAPQPVFDPGETKSLLSIAGALRNHPNGEYVAKLADQLRLAAALIAAGNSDILVAQREQADSMRKLDAEIAAHRKTRAESAETERILRAQHTLAVEALDTISKDARGAKAVALLAVEKIGGVK